MALSNPNHITICDEHGAQLKLAIEAESPKVSADFSATQASVMITATIGQDSQLSRPDSQKLQLLSGRADGKYTSDSVLGRLHGYLAKVYNTPIKFQIPLQLPDEKAELKRNGQIIYRVILNPIPDELDAAGFTRSVRRILNHIKQEIEPDSHAQTHGI